MSGLDALPLMLGALARLTGIDRDPWLYALVSGLHILGFSLLVGGIVPVALAMMSRASVFSELALRRLRQGAAFGLGLAMLTGLILLGARAEMYLAHPVVQMKLALVLLGVLHALVFHAVKSSRAGFWPIAGSGVLSLVLWLAVLALGRAIAFAIQA